MIRDICKDIILLAQPATPATAADISLGKDLLETLVAHKDGCVGMAANMIGVPKAIIAFDDEGTYTVLYNPVLVKKDKPYQTEEGCLSLTGTRQTTRYRSVKVGYQTEEMVLRGDTGIRYKTYTGWTAQIIQHEIDHLAGILI